MKNKKNKIASKGKSILNTAKPRGIGDFLSEESQKNQIRKSVNTDTRTNKPNSVREEFRFSFGLAEKLRKYAFETRRTKTAIVIEALENFLKKEN